MIIKPATELSEIKQIHQLNYKTFVEEIPQHQQNDEKVLIDKFNTNNQYIVAKRGDRVIGMVCYNTQRPFSLDQKVPHLDTYLPSYTHIAEVRLLSVCPEERKPTVSYRLLQFLCSQLIRNSIDTAVISGTTRQLDIYFRMGFTPFYSLVGKPGAWYQPMYITINNVRNDFTNS